MDGIRSLPGFGNLDLRIKWPNDIMVGPLDSGDGTIKKIGGVLITSSFQNRSFVVIIGVGKNL